MALPRVSVERMIQNQRVRRRVGSGVSRRVGSFFVRIAKIFGVLVGLALAGGLGFYLYRFILSDYFELKKLAITGVSGNVAAEIRALTKLEPNQRINLLFVKEKVVRETVLKHPRIRSAVVRKWYPNALMIEGHERQPVAVVPCGALYLIDRDGYVLDTASSLDQVQGQYPFITGINADQIVLGQPIPTKAVSRALDLFACVRDVSPALAKTMSEVRVGEDEGLTLVLSGGVEVWFGTGEFVDRLAALDLFAQKRRNLELLEYIDLRFKNQIVYRPRERGEGASAIGNPQSNTRTGRSWSANQARRAL